MIKAKRACEDAGIAYPKELEDYFHNEACESEEYLIREMEEIDIRAAVTCDSADMKDIRDVDLSKLPPDVKSIRFIVSY